MLQIIENLSLPQELFFWKNSLSYPRSLYVIKRKLIYKLKNIHLKYFKQTQTPIKNFPEIQNAISISCFKLKWKMIWHDGKIPLYLLLYYVTLFWHEKTIISILMYASNGKTKSPFATIINLCTF